MWMPFNPTQKIPGSAPGIEHDEITALSGSEEPLRITCIDFCPTHVTFQEIEDLDSFLAKHRPDWSTVRWINVERLTDMNVVHALATKYNLHPLAVEDVLHTTQRPKMEQYGGEDSEVQARLFIVTRAFHLQDGHLKHSQVSIFLGHNTVLTFQEAPNEIWQPIRHRLQSKGSRLRGLDASFLAYSLLDAIIDNSFSILEYYGNRAEELEDQILENSHRGMINEIHQYKRDLLLLRWAVWPMREVVNALKREPHECVSETTHVYLNDLYDHIVQIIDIIETYREMASDLTETYMSSISNHMNEVMKVLTMIGTIFIPLTFLAGVYGMNFHFLPELNMPWAYPVFWIVCLILAGAMVFFFRKRSWI